MSETHLSINVAARNNEEGQKNTFQAKLGPLRDGFIGLVEN